MITRKKTSITGFLIFILLSFLLPLIASTNYEDSLLPIPEIIEINVEGIQWHKRVEEGIEKEIEFYEDGICLKIKSECWFFWQTTTYECLRIQEPGTEQGLFLSCCSNFQNCRIMGEIKEVISAGWLSYFGYSSHAFLYKMKKADGEDQSIMSTKESIDGLTSIIFYSSEKENKNLQIARIEIYGQGINKENKERVVISRFTTQLLMKHLVLVAGQNLKTYAENLYVKIAGNLIKVFSSKMSFGQSLKKELNNNN